MEMTAISVQLLP